MIHGRRMGRAGEAGAWPGDPATAAAGRRRLISRHPEGRPNVFTVASRHGWQYLEWVHEDRRRRVREEHVFRPAAGRATAHYLNDYLLGLKYTTLRGPAEETRLIAAQIREVVAVYEEAEVLAMFAAADTPAARTRAIRHVAVAAPARWAPRFFEAMTAAFADPDPAVRRAAVEAVGYVGWAELVGPLGRLRDDPNPAVRAEAEGMVRAMLRAPPPGDR